MKKGNLIILGMKKEITQDDFKKLKFNWMEDIDKVEGFRIKYTKIQLVAFGRVFLGISK